MAITDQDPNEKRADLTKRALLDAAIKLFGQKGFENTTIRDLITEADVNLAAINYHFGSKEGLRYAAIDHLACMFEEDGPGEALRQAIKQPIETMSPDEARTAIREVMRGSFIRSTMDEMADAKSRYIQRELIQGGKPTELFFEKVFSLQFGVMRRLVARITGEDPDSETVRLRSVNLVAQSAFLNLARPLVLMALDWDGYTEDKSHTIADAFWLHHE